MTSSLPIITLLLGGRRVPMTRAALERASPDVLLPLADLKEPDARFNTLELQIHLDHTDGVAAVHAYLSHNNSMDDAKTQALLRDLLKHEHADVEAYLLADKYGMHDLMRFIEAERVLRPCNEKQQNVQDVLMRFDWHPGVVRALLDDLQARMDAPNTNVQVADVVRTLRERALTLVVSEREAASDRAKGCVVVCWDKTALPRDQFFQPDQYHPPWMYTLHGCWIDACYGQQRPPVMFTVLEAFDGAHAPYALPHTSPRRTLRLDPQHPAGWLDCLLTPPINTLVAAWDMRSVEELEQFVQNHMFKKKSGNAEELDCLVELMVDGRTGSDVFNAHHPSIVHADRHRPLELAAMASRAKLSQIMYPVSDWQPDDDDNYVDTDDASSDVL